MVMPIKLLLNLNLNLSEQKGERVSKREFGETEKGVRERRARQREREREREREIEAVRNTTLRWEEDRFSDCFFFPFFSSLQKREKKNRELCCSMVHTIWGVVVELVWELEGSGRIGEDERETERERE